MNQTSPKPRSKKARSFVLYVKVFLLRFVAATYRPLAVRWAVRMFFTPPRTEGERSHDFVADRIDVRVRGKRIAAWRWDPAPGHPAWERPGPVVLLSHGWGGHAGQFNTIAAALLRRGFSVVTFDAPAHGESEGERTNLVEFSEAAEAVAREVGPVYGLVAHSMGAPAAVLAMQRGLRIERAVFLAPPSNMEERLRTFVRLAGLKSEFAKEMGKRIESIVGRPTESLRVVEIAPHLTTSLLVVHDSKDREVPWREGFEISQAWPGARFITTVGKGHTRLLENEDVVHQTVRFITDNAGVEREYPETEVRGMEQALAANLH